MKLRERILSAQAKDHADAKALGLDPTWGRDHLPKLTPPAWMKVEDCGDGAKYMREDGLSVIMSGAIADDGKRWLHVSASRARRLPSWGDMRHVKAVFLGDEVTAIQVFVPKSQWVNLHPYCLHLWHCLDGDPLPDFTRGSGSI